MTDVCENGTGPESEEQQLPDTCRKQSPTGKEKDVISISDHFGYARLLRFTGPVAAMMVFTSIYGVVDGLFVSNVVGTEAFAALNLVYPILMMLASLGLMLGTGGSALVAKTLGEGEDDRAKGLFSMILYVTIAVGIVCTVVCILLIEPVCRLMGADGELLDLCMSYGRVLSLGITALMLQQACQSFLTASGKPKLGFGVIVLAGVTNVVLDAVFIVGLDFGLVGAALATVCGAVVGGIVPVVLFAIGRAGTLRLGKPLFDPRALGKSCVNGLSELVGNISMSLVATLYNYQLMRLIGSDGVAAYGVIQYVVWIFMSLEMGFTMGLSPLVSYQYGARNREELQNLFRKSMVVI